MVRWTKWKTLLSRPSAFGNETGTLPNGYYEPKLQILNDRIYAADESKVLIVGAGGLGCEILKVKILYDFNLS